MLFILPPSFRPGIPTGGYKSLSPKQILEILIGVDASNAAEHEQRKKAVRW